MKMGGGGGGVKRGWGRHCLKCKKAKAVNICIGQNSRIIVCGQGSPTNAKKKDREKKDGRGRGEDHPSRS